MNGNNTVEFIVKSWIENDDVEPYLLSENGAKEITEMMKQDLPEGTTPEEVRKVWNDIIRKHFGGIFC